MTDISELSEREVEILQLVATGASNKEIAKQLYISTNTVKVHLRNIFTKIGAASRTEAAMYAVQSGLVKAGGGEEQGLSHQFPVDEDHTGKSSIFYRNIAIALIGLLLIAAIIFGVSVLQNQNIFASSPEELVAEETRWQILSDLPTARRGLAVTAFENTVYAIAGETVEGVTGITEIYQPETDTWNTGIPKPLPVVDVQAIVLGGKIYIPGGQLASGEVTNILEIYHPRSNEWGRGADMPIGISAYAMTAFEGNLYVFGGWGGEDYLDTVFEYDPIQDSWVELTQMPIKRAYGGAAVSGGKIYVLGGMNKNGAISSNDIFSPELELEGAIPWNKGVSLPDARYAMGVTNVVENIYVIGGSNNDADPFYSYIYLPATNEWQRLGHPFSQTLTKFGQVLLGMRIYFIGGELGDERISQNISYQAIYTLSIPVVSKSDT